MTARITNRGRGPEIEGTRITVYSMMDYVREGDSVDVIAAHLRLTREQVEVALDYINAHREEVEQEYERILERAANRRNPPWVDAILAKSPEELKARIRARQMQDATHADRPGH